MIKLAFAIFCMHALSPEYTEAEQTEILVNGATAPYETWHESVMPGDIVDVEIPSGFRATVDGEVLRDDWQAPDRAGIHLLEVRNPRSEKVLTMSIFVLEPAANVNSDGYLNGYRIGSYPQNTPRGFIRLEQEDFDTPVSPSFRLGQFLCKQQPDHFPKYLLVSKPNLRRLETLLTSLKSDGITDADTFFVMSGFRTPFYNTAIGSARLSRHMYGDATDIYVDVNPQDGVMDDINDDGLINKADADFLYDYAARLFASADVMPGGLGPYRTTAAHGPFLHVDGRGRAARWNR